MPSLKWIAPEGRPQVFPIFKKITTVGRGAGNDVAIDAPSLGEFHAQLVFDGRDFNISAVDAGSVVRINGKKKRRGKIHHNDRLLLGDVEFVFSVYDEGVLAGEGARGGDAEGAEIAGMLRLGEFNRRLLEIRAIPDQMRALLDAVIEATGAAKGFIILLRDGEAEIAAARNLERRDIPDGVKHLSDSILSKVVETRRPLIVSDALHHEDFSGSESVMNLKLCSVMVAPLITQGQLLGLIYVGNDNVVSLFEQSSLDLLTIFAGQAGLILQNAILLDELETDRDQLQEQLSARRFGDIIGTCPTLLEVFRRVEKVAPTDVSVLITGETGTGKELVAQEIHRRSERSGGPFVVVNCGAIPENLLESELFGHMRGAFTGAVATRGGRFQQANGGTLFLDEIGEMPAPLQVKILRALQEREVVKVGGEKPDALDIRVLAATHRDLEQAILDGGFREDLYYRLNVVNLHLPPLRERGDDVTLLARYLVKRYAEEYGSKVSGFTKEAVVAMLKYPWPGNVRQLENRIKKAVVLADKTLLGPEELDLFPEALAEIVPLSQAREDFTRRYIMEVLERNNGNRTKTAGELGVDPRTVFRYLEKESDSGSSSKA